MNTKYCNKCEQHLTLDNFYNDKTSADGKQRYCKHCVKSYQQDFNKRYSKRNIQKLLANPNMTLTKLRNYFGVYVEIEEAN